MDIEGLGSDLLHSVRLRVVAVGSVDDGKSTLIGRLLHDAHRVFEDQLRSMRCGGAQGAIDFSFLTDGLLAEREQGVTIDVAYRYFSTPRRHFMVADTPGHEQYTRNMVTGASNADLAVILVDASRGVTTQSKRHAFLASLLGVRHLVVVINKMDLTGYSREAFEAVRRDFGEFVAKLGAIDLAYLPVSALHGDNVVVRSQSMPWYEGPPLLSHLETVCVGSDTNMIDLRFPVQMVVRGENGFRGYAGQMASGVMRVGSTVIALPSGRISRVKRIMTCNGEAEHAFAPQSIAVVLEDEIDVSRGDMLAHPANVPRTAEYIEAMVVWMDERPLEPRRQYIVRQTNRSVKAKFTRIEYRIDPDDLHRRSAIALAMNDTGRVTLQLYSPLLCDEYTRNRKTGSFTVIDPETNATAAAGIVIERSRQAADREGYCVKTRRMPVPTPATHENAWTIWLTGLSGSGKSTLARALETRLREMGFAAFVLDGDRLRKGLTRDLGFSPDDRKENIRRTAETARLFNEAGVIAIVALISPYRADRELARLAIGEDRFVEVFVDATIEACEARDIKGLYRRARAGEISEFTGISAPYEKPLSPTIHLRTDKADVEQCVARILSCLDSKGGLS